MPEITLDNETIAYIRLFEEATGAQVKDCLEAEDKRIFLIPSEDLRKAIGPGGVLVERLKTMLKKEIVVVEYSVDPARLALNVFYPYHPIKVEFAPKERGRHVTVTVDPVWKARAIGKQGKQLKIARAILVRHTDIVSVSVA